jgi:molecular chaperone GrpE
MEGGNEAVKQLHAGMELTYTMLLNTVKKYGVEQISPEGQPFNPALHEAMSMTEAVGVAKDTVITVFQKGYLLNGRLLRPARVIVAK